MSRLHSGGFSFTNRSICLLVKRETRKGKAAFRGLKRRRATMCSREPRGSYCSWFRAYLLTYTNLERGLRPAFVKASCWPTNTLLRRESNMFRLGGRVRVLRRDSVSPRLIHRTWGEQVGGWAESDDSGFPRKSGQPILTNSRKGDLRDEAGSDRIGSNRTGLFFFFFFFFFFF
jgi:hypothetical protein